MRFAALALVVCLAGCSLTSSGNGGECTSDAQCGEEVCARTGECLPRASVRDVTVRWTVDGAPADTASCASRQDLYLQFDGSDYGDTLRVAPVACSDGSGRISKLPKRYVRVELGTEGGASDVLPISTGSSAAAGDTAAQAQFDLHR